MNKNIPSNLSSGPIKLFYEKIVQGNEFKGLVPFYHFKILNEQNNIVGHINFKVGDTPHIKLYAGHVGFQIEEKSRGKSYSYYACLALAPFIKLHRLQVILTVDPTNIASKKIINKLGAQFIEVVRVPPEDPAYAGGAREKERYEWIF